MSFTPPFVLLDDARAGDAAPARLYTDPVEIVTTRHSGEVAAALAALRTATRGGLHAAGYLAYEAGAALEPKLAGAHTSEAPLLWFGLFRDYREIAPGDVAALLSDPAGGWLGTPVPDVSQTEYEAQLAQVKALIEAGDIYQANLTFRTTVATAGHPLALYSALRARAASPYAAVVATGRQWLLSLSPELSFALRDGKVTTRPMKGTIAPDADPALLTHDPKQRAENLMIVDLLRNDLSRVAATGSVAVPELFRVERYPTVQQMTSTVTAQLAEGRDAVMSSKHCSRAVRLPARRKSARWKPSARSRHGHAAFTPAVSDGSMPIAARVLATLRSTLPSARWSWTKARAEHSSASGRASLPIRLPPANGTNASQRACSCPVCGAST